MQTLGEWKSNVKKKARNIQTELHSTGGGPATQPNMTALEERLLAVLRRACIEGVPNGVDLIGQPGCTVFREEDETPYCTNKESPARKRKFN